MNSETHFIYRLSRHQATEPKVQSSKNIRSLTLGPASLCDLTLQLSGEVCLSDGGFKTWALIYNRAVPQLIPGGVVSGFFSSCFNAPLKGVTEPGTRAGRMVPLPQRVVDAVQ